MTAPPSVLPDGVELLVSHEDGIELRNGRNSITVVEGFEVAVAFPDGAGGVIFQRPPTQPDWSLAPTGSYQLIWPEGIEPTPIEWIPVIGYEPQILIPGTHDAVVDLIDVADYGSQRVVVYRETLGVEDPCEWYRANVHPDLNEDECMWVAMHSVLGVVTALDLEDGDEWPLGIERGWDAATWVALGGEHVATVEPGLPPEGPIQIVNISDLRSLDRLDWTVDACNESCISIEPQLHCPFVEPYRVDTLGGTFSSDGKNFVYVEYHGYSCTTYEGHQNEVVVVGINDPQSRSVVPLTTSSTLDGSVDSKALPVVLDFWNTLAIVAGDGSVQLVSLPPANHYALWTGEVPDRSAAITIEPDGLDVVSFGDDLDSALAILTEVLGPPTSHERHTDVWGEQSTYGSFHEVRWRGLRLEFVDWDVNFRPLDSPVFSYWTTGRPLRTSEGVGPGSLWTEVATTYGDGAKAWSEDCGEYSGAVFHFFSIEIDGEGDEHIAGFAYFGWLTADPSYPASSVAQMEAGREAFPQGC